MRSYRLVLVLKGDLKKEDKQKVLSEVKKWVGDPKKEEVKELGEKKLMYPIKHAQKADFVAMFFDTDKIVDDIHKKLEIQDSVLRHLLVRVK